MKTLKFQKLHPDAVLPSRGTADSCGLDLSCIENVEILPLQRIAVRTGLAVEIPTGSYGRVAPRSGLALRMGIDVLAGVIDADYRGEILCLLVNLGDVRVVFSAGDRIAQLIIEAVSMLEPEWSDELYQTDRHNRGFGSTGNQTA